MPDSFTLSGGRVAEIGASASDRRKVSVSGSTVYYKNARNVSAVSNDGSLTSGSSLVFSEPTYLLSASNSSVVLSEVDELRADSWLSVKDFGAYGDGVHDDRAAIQAALDYAYGLGGATVFFPPGTYMVTSTLSVDSGVILTGAGRKVSKIKLAGGANCDLIRTAGYATYVGGGTTNGPTMFGFRDISLDGNKASNSGGKGVAIYGRNYTIENVTIYNTSSDGLWSQWYTSGDEMEASITNLKVLDSGAKGIHWDGPHDSTFSRCQVVRSATTGIRLDTGLAAGTMFNQCHVWGSQAIAWDIRTTGTQMIGCIGEGSSSVQCILDAQTIRMVGCQFFGIGVGDTSTALQVGDTGTGAYPSDCIVEAQLTSVNKCIDVQREGGYNKFDLVTKPKSGGTVGIAAGTFQSSDTVLHRSDGIASSGMLQLTGGPTVRVGTGAPGGVVAGYIGDLYLRSDGGASTTLYVKESGAGTSAGWVGK